ncbi:MAG: hypothetical protein JWQ10_4134 [Herbaspirillum sp.]|nr:hypothetical protein [Herbaspirillum sp.]
MAAGALIFAYLNEFYSCSIVSAAELNNFSNKNKKAQQELSFFWATKALGTTKATRAMRGY